MNNGQRKVQGLGFEKRPSADTSQVNSKKAI